MSTGYDAFLSEVLPWVPNCGEIVAINAIRNACIDFCALTAYWQHDTYPVPLSPSANAYGIDVPDNTKVIEILDVWVDGRRLRPRDEPLIRNQYVDQDFRAQSGTPLYYARSNPDEVTLYPTPDLGQNGKLLSARVFVAPTRASTTVLDSVYERYAELIAKGAIARLKSTPMQPYSDPQGAIMYARLFHAETMQVRALVQRNKTRTGMQVRFNGSIG